MVRDRRKARATRRPGAGGAILRAMLLVGPIALAIAFGVSPKAERPFPVFAQGGTEGLDTVTTGSVAASSNAFALARPGSPDRPCLRLPDGMQRGAC